MATSMATAAAAAEELFLRGEYAEALAESQAKLAQRTLEVRRRWMSDNYCINGIKN